MTTIAEHTLAACIAAGSGMREIEPGIFAAAGAESAPNAYDTDFGNIYEWVACNPLYNRLVWGYSIRSYAAVASKALAACEAGPVLDLACGSLAFTAETYTASPARVVICADQSLKMLRMAKARLLRLMGAVPEHMVFILADALRLPLRPCSFGAVMCLNLLHCLPDAAPVLRSLKRLAQPGAALQFTTLVPAGRLADGYLRALARSGKLVSRTLPEIEGLFRDTGYAVESTTRGNLAFVTATVMEGEA